MFSCANGKDLYFQLIFGLDNVSKIICCEISATQSKSEHQVEFKLNVKNHQSFHILVEV